jgi:RTX calcium-binding nonapeptide repeat (4 copies)
MSRTRLLAAIVGALLTLAFATSALAAGGGSPGDDNVTGSAHGDRIALEAGDDHVNGGRGDDVVRGDAGDDRLNGGAGDDRVNGGVGDDVVTDDRGSDRLSGGVGDDRINVRDRRGRNDVRDVVDCGAGDDTALVDDDDLVRHCEHVVREPGDDNGVHASGTDDHGVHAPGTDDHGVGASGADDAPGHR